MRASTPPIECDFEENEHLTSGLKTDSEDEKVSYPVVEEK